MDDWDERIDAVWADDGARATTTVIARIDALAAERAADDARALFERAGARDSAGRRSRGRAAVPRGPRAGLDEEHRAAGRDPAREHAAQSRTQSRRRSRCSRAEFDRASRLRRCTTQPRAFLRARAGRRGRCRGRRHPSPSARSHLTCRSTRARWRPTRDELVAELD